MGLAEQPLELIRDHANAIFRVQGSGIVLRVADGTNIGRAQQAITFARWLDVHGYPAVRALDGVAQPIEVAHHVITAWEYLSQPDDPPSSGSLGPLLASLHYRLPADEFAAPDFEPFGFLTGQLGQARIPGKDYNFLKSRLEALRDEFDHLSYRLPAGLIHGDAHRGNLLWRASSVVMCDFDDVCYGPREWDLVPTAVDMLRFGRPKAQYQEFSESYGTDVMDSPCWQTLSGIREIQMLVGLARKAHLNPSKGDEFTRRVGAMRDDVQIHWQAF